jgi:hypothetical protein
MSSVGSVMPSTSKGCKGKRGPEKEREREIKKKEKNIEEKKKR